MPPARTIDDVLRNPSPGEPTWGMAQLYPPQGSWTEEEYLALDTNVRVEYVDGRLEFPPMPTKLHQWIGGYLYRLLFGEISDRRQGDVYFAGYRVQIEDRYREPDVVCILNRNLDKAGQRYTTAADLVVEVVSEDDPDRDWVTKRTEYAVAGITEYWIADPRDQTLTIFTLDPGSTEYREAGRYQQGDSARSVLLDGLTIDVAAVFSTL